MSTFINNDITNDGRLLLAKGHLGQKIEFTKIVMGDGYLPPGTAIREMNAVVNPVVYIPISKMKINADSTVIIGGQFSNADILTEFFYRELALFAKGEDGIELLYCYGNAGDFAERITPVGGSSVIEKLIDIVTAIGTTTNVTANIIRTTSAEEIGYNDSITKFGAGSIQEAIEMLAKNNNSMHDIDENIVFSAMRPTGDWQIWLQDLGEVDNLFENGGALELMTAPISVPRDFDVEDETGEGETVLNMTDNPQAAEQDDIILTQH